MCTYYNIIEDLATSDRPKVETALDVTLTDRNDNTCWNTQTENITMTWNESFVFTWLRIVFNDPVVLSYVKVQFKENSTAPLLDCGNKRLFLVNPTTMDIECNVTEIIKHVIITGVGVKYMCSLYINGGRNMALLQNAWQTSNYLDNPTYNASKAVDGNANMTFNNNSCTHTTGNEVPIWGVKLKPSEITRYVLYNRDDKNNFRLKGFELTTQNSGSIQFQYNDNNSAALPVYTVLDPQKTLITQVNITVNNNNILTLCEVEIYGECPSGWDLDCKNCRASCANTCHIENGQCNMVCFGFSNPPACTTGCTVGKFGINCTQPCPGNCRDSKCNAVTGFCINCIAGYQGEQCSKDCNSSFWGLNCNRTCSAYCVDNICDKVNGSCSKGCEAGFQLPNCDTDCNNGYWGINCAYTCGNCTSQPCDKKNGQCPSGCQDGYIPPMCDQKCNETNYGTNCSLNCSTNCTNQKCHHVNGKCNLCIPGYKGDYCDQICDETKYGQNCSLNCSTSCKDAKCNHVNGICNMCYDGYQGNECEQVCNATKYGPNCSLDCSNNCTNQECHHVNGTCNLCYRGYQGLFCEQTCDATTYGQNCSLNCSTNCTDKFCQPTTGHCYKCYPGFHGDVCNEYCPSSTYGQNCSQTCSSNCNKSKECDPVQGTCYGDCQAGYIEPLCTEQCSSGNYGAKCNSTCSNSCQSKTCNHASGECLVGCLENYSGPFCETYKDPVNVGAIAGSIIAILVTAVLIAAGAIFWKRRYHKKSDGNNSEELTLKTPDFSKTIDDEGESPYSNISETVMNTKIDVENLKDYLRTHNTEVLAEQYRKVPKPKNVTTDVGLSEENKAKNRYKNICPYDHSRVNLMINSGKQEGDYINASYVRDNHNGVKFIAAQGPYEAVVNDFVRMLWEQKIEKVVMLTNLIEEGKVKCDKYWPDSGKSTFGEIEVKLKETHIFADYTIRTIELEKMDEKTRTLTHFHFTSWPDQGVPLTPWALVDFEQRINVNDSTAPVLVHCSAGVGRTGTFIALHNIIQQADETGYVDFYNTLVKLREDRFLMIQTPDQYIFLHKAAQAAIVSMGTTVTSSDMKTRLRHLQEKTDLGISNMEKEFNNICDICQEENEAIQEAESVYQNADSLKIDLKNRFPSIIPSNSYRPYLTCESKEMDSYINAVFLQGFQKKDQHILTQLPMPSTVTDFWRMVTQYKVSLVVAFEVDNMKTDQTIANYLPSEENSMSSSKFEIQCTAKQDNNLWEELHLKVVTDNSKAIQHNLIHLKCKVTDIDANKLLTFVNKARSLNAQANGRIIYTCRNGATYSGLACVLSLLLDRMEQDTCLAVPLVVGSIKSIRTQVIPTFEQYYMLHEALQRYNETTGTYSNMEDSILPNFSKGRTSLAQPSDESHYGNGNIYSNM